GLFRTQSEVSRRKNLREDLLGISTSLAPGEGSNAGITIIGSRFSRHMNLSGARPFEGDGGVVASANCRISLPGCVMFGECLVRRPVYGVFGALLSPSSGMSVLALYRRYSAQVPGLHGLGFGERAGGSGEEGFYAGLRLRVSRE